MNPISLDSFTAFLNRMIDSAPTREKARAILDPMISMIRDTTVAMMIMVCTKDWE
jgi:hypothetical protein